MEKQLTGGYPIPKWTDFPDIELYMDQVIGVLEKHLAPFFPEEKCITSTMINNYVKQKLLPPPQNKRYAKEQLAHLFMICILKSHLQLSEIASLLENLCRERSIAALYELFTVELEGAVKGVCEKENPGLEPCRGETEEALRAVLFAFAAIIYSKKIFCLAEKNWPVKETEDKEKKEKKEKKDKKDKEKKEKEKKKELKK